MISVRAAVLVGKIQDNFAENCFAWYQRKYRL